MRERSYFKECINEKRQQAYFFLLLTVFCFVSDGLAAETPQEAEAITKELQTTGGAIQPIGMTNDAYAMYFTGQSYLVNMSTDKSFPVYNVSFAHGAQTFWHIHHKTCQVLIAESGRGYFQLCSSFCRDSRPPSLRV